MQPFDFLLQNTALYPFRFEPIYKKYLWGGGKFRTMFRRPIPDGDEPYAESWEIADHRNGRSVIRNGPLRGTLLGDVVRARPKELFGIDRFDPASPPAAFPLILKYLDAKQVLSVQVHPDDRLAAEMGLEDRGKTEAWVVVDAEPGSTIYIGTRGRCTKQELSEIIRRGELESILNRVQVEIGDCFYLSPGTLHALGENVLVAEIQTTSDTTFRVFDWNRLDKDGKARELKIDEAIQAINEPCMPVYPQQARVTDDPHCEQLVSDPMFTMNRRTLTGPYSWNSDGCCHLWTVLDGSVDALFKAGRRSMPRAVSGRDADPDGIEVLNRGDSLLVPAMCTEIRWVPESKEPVVLLDTVVKQC